MAAVNGISILAVLVVMMVVAKLVGDADAATYVVRDAVGWKIPPNGSAEYVDWASKHVFAVGDVLVFNFTTGIHDVARVTKESFDACNINTTLSLSTIGPANITLNTTGDNYYICTFGRHCISGQKLAINVTGSSTGSPPSPDTSPSPPLPGAHGQSPPSSSTTVMITCTSFALIFSSVIYGLVAI